MPSPLSGPGLGLPIPTNLYPTALTNAPYDYGTNKVALGPGEQIPIPAGDWYINLGGYLVIQFLDPLTNTWVMSSGSAFNRGMNFVKSDGFNARIANLTGCPVGGVITSAGASYVQATTTISVTGGGGSTWAPIIGGALQMATSTIVTAQAGAGYGTNPIVVIPNPPPPANNVNGIGGIAASAWANVSSGTISGFTFTNSGAGYPSAPGAIVLLPNPTDPNINTGITLATMNFSLTKSGSLTGVLMTNPGAPLALPASITLAVSGAGVTASVQAVYMQAVTAATVSSPGVGYGTAQGLVTTVGGVPPQGLITTDPNYEYLAWFPRQAQIGLTPANTSVSVATAGVIYDGGLFVSNTTPNPVWVTGGTVGTISTIGAIALTCGGVADIAVMQPAP